MSKTHDGAFKPGQEVWFWNHWRLERRTVEAALPWNREAYRLIKTTAYSDDVVIGGYLYAYPQDREALMDEMQDDISSIQFSLNELAGA